MHIISVRIEKDRQQHSNEWYIDFSFDRNPTIVKLRTIEAMWQPHILIYNSLYLCCAWFWFGSRHQRDCTIVYNAKYLSVNMPLDQWANVPLAKSCMYCVLFIVAPHTNMDSMGQMWRESLQFGFCVFGLQQWIGHIFRSQSNKWISLNVNL